MGDDEDPSTCDAASHVLDVHGFLRFDIFVKNRTSFLNMDVDSTDMCRVAVYVFELT